jgi:hypothetical protein
MSRIDKRPEHDVKNKIYYSKGSLHGRTVIAVKYYSFNLK